MTTDYSGQPLWNFAEEEHSDWFKANFPDQASFRLKQIRDWVFKKFVIDPEKMSNLPESITSRLPPALLTHVETQKAKDNSAMKLLFQCRDGHFLESVILSGKDRKTLCVSTQIGCPLACAFCRTGSNGFARNLSAGEIVEQFLRANSTTKINNIVVMGMGEALLNRESVVKALRVIGHPKLCNLGARHITVSTAGVPGGIEFFAEQPEQWNLAISLHAADEALRRQLMPSSAKVGVSELVRSADAYVKKTRRRVTWEVVLLDGVNDSLNHANELASLLRGRLAHVNLIPYNPSPGLPFKPTSPERAKAFCERVAERGVPCTLRIEKGGDILAACGQLAHKRSG